MFHRESLHGLTALINGTSMTCPNVRVERLYGLDFHERLGCLRSKRRCQNLFDQFRSPVFMVLGLTSRPLAPVGETEVPENGNGENRQILVSGARNRRGSWHYLNGSFDFFNRELAKYCLTAQLQCAY